MTEPSSIEAEIARARQSALDSLNQAAAAPSPKMQLPREITADPLPPTANSPRPVASLEKRSHSMSFEVPRSTGDSAPASDSPPVDSSGKGGTGALIFKDCAGDQVARIDWADGLIITAGEQTVEGGCPAQSSGLS